MKKPLVILALILAPSLAQAQSSKSTIISNINGDFADNTSGAITAGLLRSVTTEIVSSYVDWITCTTTGGLIVYNGTTPLCLANGSAGQYLRAGSPTPVWSNVASGLTAGSGIGITGTITPTISVSDVVLNGLQALSSTGFPAITATGIPDTFASRTMSASTGITITNPSGIAGNPSFALTNQIAAGGPTGSATVVPTITYNAQGQLTAVSSNTISASTLLDVIGATQGSVLYRGASGWSVLSPVTSGLVLASGGAAANPGWTAVPGTSVITAGGPTGSATVVPTITYNGNGQLTAVSSNTISASTLLDVIGSTQGQVLYRSASGWAVLTPGTSGQVFTTGGAGANPSYTTVAGTGTVQSVTCGNGLSCSTNPITVSGTITPSFTTSSQYVANTTTQTTLLEPSAVWASAIMSVLPAPAPGGTITPDFSTGYNFAITVTGNVVIGNPTNRKIGQSGCIYITMGSTTGTVSVPQSNPRIWLFAGGTQPTATVSANSKDRMCYQVGPGSFLFATYENAFQ